MRKVCKARVVCDEDGARKVIADQIDITKGPPETVLIDISIHPKALSYGQASD
jgi:hypothetical protein